MEKTYHVTCYTISYNEDQHAVPSFSSISVHFDFAFHAWRSSVNYDFAPKVFDHIQSLPNLGSESCYRRAVLRDVESYFHMDDQSDSPITFIISRTLLTIVATQFWLHQCLEEQRDSPNYITCSNLTPSWGDLIREKRSVSFWDPAGLASQIQIRPRSTPNPTSLRLWLRGTTPRTPPASKPAEASINRAFWDYLISSTCENSTSYLSFQFWRILKTCISDLRRATNNNSRTILSWSLEIFKIPGFLVGVSRVGIACENLA